VKKFDWHKKKEKKNKLGNLAPIGIFNRLFDFRRDFDGLFNGILTGALTGSGSSASLLGEVPPIETWVDPNEKKYHLSIALAGIDPSEVRLSLQGNTLTVSAEHQADDQRRDANYIQREFSYAPFERVIDLPEAVDTQKLTAQYDNGVLEIVGPVKAEALPKKIEIKNLPAASSQGSAQEGGSQCASTKVASAS
jgi:HSP20 family protein